MQVISRWIREVPDGTSTQDLLHKPRHTREKRYYVLQGSLVMILVFDQSSLSPHVSVRTEPWRFYNHMPRSLSPRFGVIAFFLHLNNAPQRGQHRLQYFWSHQLGMSRMASFCPGFPCHVFPSLELIPVVFVATPHVMQMQVVPQNHKRFIFQAGESAGKHQSNRFRQVCMIVVLLLHLLTGYYLSWNGLDEIIQIFLTINSIL